MKNFKSVLKLDRVVFDQINFDRLGFKNEENELQLKIETDIGKSSDGDVYKVTVAAIGLKLEEYKFRVSITGYFVFESNEQVSEDVKSDLITKNSVAILMPYLRSEISLLTAQPETETVVLPVFNINSMIDQ